MPLVYPPAAATGGLEPIRCGNLFVASGQGNNAATVQAQLRAHVASLVGQHPALKCVDAQLSGGGPGAVFVAMVLATLSDPNSAYPLLSDMLFQVIEAPTQFDLLAQLNLPGNAPRYARAWSQAVGGGGSPFLILAATSGAP